MYGDGVDARRAAAVRDLDEPDVRQSLQPLPQHTPFGLFVAPAFGRSAGLACEQIGQRPGLQ